MPRDTGGPSPDEMGINVKAEGLKMDLRNARDARNWGEYVKVAVEIQKQGESVPLDDESLHNINQMVEEYRANHQWDDFVIIARDMQTLGQEPQINDGDWHNIIKRFSSMSQKESRQAVRDIATKLGRAEDKIEAETGVDISMQGELDRAERNNNWDDFVIIARDMYSNGLTPKINDGQWFRVKQRLGEMPEESRLAAQEVAAKIGKA